MGSKTTTGEYEVGLRGGAADEEEDDGAPEQRMSFQARAVTRLSRAVKALKEGEALDMKQVTLLMWQARERPELERVVASMLQERHASKALLNGVEFYLPQIVHMLVHLEVNWPDDLLQEFVLMVAQVSMHFALQMFWTLVGYLEDAQPEFENGKRNPHGSSAIYLRCSTLLYALERAVVYGDNSEVAELEERFQKGKLPKAELDKQLRELRLRHAKRLVSYGDEGGELEGELLYKREKRSNVMASKGWKPRRFVIKHRMLLCFRIRDGELKRAVPLHGAEIKELAHRTHEWYFEVHEESTNRVLKLAAPNERTRAQWIKHIRKAASAPPLIKPGHLVDAEMSSQQGARHAYFQAELAFARSMTDMSEVMRFVDKEDRRGALKRSMLRLGKNIDAKMGLYLPIRQSTDEFEGVVDVDANACVAFSTRERCPVLLTFAVAGARSDIATTLRARYGESASHEATFGERLTAALVPALSRMPSSVWEEEELAATAPAQMSRMVVPSKTGVARIIAKAHDDVRQEVFVMQLMTFLRDVWAAEDLGLWLHPYRILSTGRTTGLIEVVEDAQSIDALKAGYMETEKRNVPLNEHFERTFTSSAELAAARKRFVESMAGYSMATYILGIHDRHNGNLMLRQDGRIVHIDFGFVLSMAPGKDKIKGTNFSPERAAFKLTNEMVAVMGGTDSDLWTYFKELCVRGMLTARAHADTLTTLVDITGHQSNLPAFKQPGGGVKRVVRELRQRLMMDVEDAKVEAKVEALIAHAKQHWGTIFYEKFQQKTNGILPMV